MKNCIAILGALLCLFTACQKDSLRVIDSSYQPDVRPTRFANPTDITNPFFPFEPGKRYILTSQTDEGLERIEKTRTADTRVVMGITCAVIHDRVWLNGVLIEETFDWHAQDNDGNVWYFGEDVTNYHPDGSFMDHGGAWEAGVDGAQPGIVMLAEPRAGMAYREEYYFNEAEDEAEVVATGETVTTPLATFTNCVKTRNWTDLEPDDEEYKWYAPGVGVVKIIKLADNQIEELIAIEE